MFLITTVALFVSLTFSSAQVCDEPYKLAPNQRCYWLDTEDVADFEGSLRVCTTTGGQLLVLEDPIEWNILREHIFQVYGACTNWNASDAQAWIAAYPRSIDLEWVWAPNELPLIFFDWLNDAPPTPVATDAVITSCYDQLQWMPRNREALKHFICEKDAFGGGTSTTTPTSTTDDITNTPSPTTTTNPGSGLCPPGYTERVGVGCYQLNANRLPFVNAQGVCQSTGGTLLEIETPNEWNAIQAILYENPSMCSSANVYIGAQERGVQNVFQWLSDPIVSFLPWAPGEPNSAGLNDALAIYCGVDFGYNDMVPTESHNYICEATYGITPTTPPSICPPNYDFVGGGASGCYRVSEIGDNLNFPDAVEQCQIEGGKLVELETEAEWIALRDHMFFIYSCYFRYFYVGALELGTHRNYVWITTTQPATVWEWHQSEPNEVAGDDGLAVSCGYSADTSRYKFNDVAEWQSAPNGYICEIEL